MPNSAYKRRLEEIIQVLGIKHVVEILEQEIELLEVSFSEDDEEEV